MPSFVITASVYVDDVNSPEEATDAVDNLNNFVQETNLGNHDVFIRLPDPDSDYKWEQSGDD